MGSAVAHDVPTGQQVSPPAKTGLPVYVLLATTLLSLFGNNLTTMGIAWFVLETTGSAERTGIAAAVTVVPAIIATFLGGTLVDRIGYRRMSVVSDLVSAVTIAAVPFFYLTTGLSFAGLLVLMFLGSILDGPGSTARQAMVPQLAERTGIPLERINANLNVVIAVSMLLSFPAAGVLIGLLGGLNVLWVNAGTMLIAAVLIRVFIPKLKTMEASGESFLREVRSGFSWVMQNQVIRFVIFAALAINMVFSPMFAVAIPYYANQELRSVGALATMSGAFALGNLLGSFLYGQIALRVPGRALFIVSVALLTFPMGAIATLPGLWVTSALTLTLGLGSGMVNPMISTFVARIAPEQMLGRVIGMLRACAMMATPVGLLTGGWLIGAIGLRGSFLVFGGILLVVLLMTVLTSALHGLNEFPDAEDSAVDEGEAKEVELEQLVV